MDSEGFAGAGAPVVQDGGAEARHGATVEDVYTLETMEMLTRKRVLGHVRASLMLRRVQRVMELLTQIGHKFERLKG